MADNSGENIGRTAPQPNFELPKGPTESGQEALAERAIEKRQVTENTPTKQAPKLTTPAAPVAAPVDDQKVVAGQHAPAASASLPAQDTDLIEKEWVERSKAIVAKTQDDPYLQKSEMSKMKVDYIKKRFDKSIPLDDSKKP